MSLSRIGQSDASRKEAAVHDDRFSRGETGSGGDEVDCGADEFVGVAKTGERGVLAEPLAARGALDERAVQVRWEDAGGDPVDADAKRRPLIGQSPDESENAGLAARVRQYFR